jgi:Family of unknown function (DUF6949)
MARRSGLCERSGRLIAEFVGVFMSAETVQAFFALALGFAWAGCLSTGYQFATSRPASFRLIERGPALAAFAAVPFLVFAAPFIIMRNTIRGRRVDGGRFSVMLASTVVAGFWSLMSGTVAITTLSAVGFFPA